MGISAQEAAAAVGLTKQGIIKSIRSGKISAQKDQNGAWQIEPVELFRVYDPAPTGLPQSSPEDTPVDTVSLQIEVRLLRDQLADKDDVIADLRRRLDDEATERHRLTLILTDKSQQPAPARPWWAKMFGGA